MEFIVVVGIILAIVFFVGLIGLILGKGNKKVYLTLLLAPIIIVVIGFGTCIVIINNL